MSVGREIQALKDAVHRIEQQCERAEADLQAAKLYPSEAEKALKAALAKIALLEGDIKKRQDADQAVPGENLGYLKERFLLVTQDRDRLKSELDRIRNEKDEQDGLMRKICEIVCEDCDR
jgi:chromosome segregation ATPase